MKKTVYALLLYALLLATPSAPAQTRVICTTFPIYQITRNIVEGQAGLSVDLMLPASLGCPHDYALTPRDMMKLARAEILIVNGHGMEEFLGAPVKQANPTLHLLDSSTGITDLMAFEPDPDAAPYEWAGWFDLQPGRYTWSFAKVDGVYADPEMTLLILPGHEQPASTFASIQELARERFDQPATDRHDGDALLPQPTPYRLHFEEASDVTRFEMLIDQADAYAVFTEHFPFEFEADEHFLKDADRRDIEPLSQYPKADHDHGHGHHHHHGGINPHLWVSPRINAEIAQNIARELGARFPDGADLFRQNAQTYAGRMTELLRDLRAGVATLPNRKIIQPHGIFDYLARDIGLEVVASTQPHGLEPSVAGMLRLLDLIHETGVGAVFSEPQYSPKVGQTLAAEAGIPWAMLDPVASGPENAPLDHFETVMRANLTTLRATLGGHE
jgi:ABC-type Zn uptake system ZnuABC Zn-binding protein ZnuA